MRAHLPPYALLLGLALNALIGCRDYASLKPTAAPVAPPPPEPPQLQYRIKRLVSGDCSGSGSSGTTTDFTYTKNLFVAQTTQPDVVRELGIPSTTYHYDAGGRLLAADFEEKIKRQDGHQTQVYSYTYSPTSIIELAQERFADGRQEFGFRRTYTLSGGLIVGYKEQYLDAGVPVTNQWTYAYTNGNVTGVLCKGQQGQIKANYSYEYDDKPNPFYRDATYNWVGSPWAGISRDCFSRNNVVKAIIRSPYSDLVTVRTFRYIYNEQGLPLTQTRDDEGCQVARYEYETY